MPHLAHQFAARGPAGVGVRSTRPVPARRRIARGVTVACLLPLAAGCEDVVVAPAAVSTIQVVPADVQVSVGGDTELSADLQDEAGRSLSGHQVTWTSDDPAVATVNATGRVTGAGSGTTTIRARVGGVEGSATARVLAAPVISLDRSSVGFTGDEGAGAPPPVNVGITNEGEAPLTGLQAAVSYSGGTSGWLSATVAGTAAPSSLTLAVTLSGLEAGEYRADVTVSSSSTQAEPVVLPVLLEVREVLIQGGPPETPSGLSATGGLTSIELSWTANSDDETEFRIHRRTGSGSHQQIATVGAGVTSFTDSDVEPATTYGYRVRACNEHGCSSLSAEATASLIVPPPPAPTNLHVAMNQRQRVRIAWEGTGPLTAVRVERAPGSGEFAVLATTDPGATFYDDRGVERRTTYRYRVFACNLTGCSDASNIITVTTPN